MSVSIDDFRGFFGTGERAGGYRNAHGKAGSVGTGVEKLENGGTIMGMDEQKYQPLYEGAASYSPWDIKTWVLKGLSGWFRSLSLSFCWTEEANIRVDIIEGKIYVNDLDDFDEDIFNGDGE